MVKDKKVELMLKIQDHHLTPTKRKIAHLRNNAMETRCAIESGGDGEKALFSDWLKEIKESLEEVSQMVRQTIALLGGIS